MSVAVAAGVATVAAAGASIYSSVKSSSGGGGGGDGGGVSGRSSPASGLLADLFGARWTNKGYKAKIGGANGIFRPNDVQSLQNLMNPVPINQQALSGVDSSITDAYGALPGAEAALDQSMSWLGPLAGPGGATDIAPIIAARKADYFNNFLPQLKESAAGAQGLFSTDWSGQADREWATQEAQLGKLDFDAQEAAKERQLRAIPMFSQQATTRAALPLSVGADALNLATTSRNAQAAARPGNDVLNLISTLGGLAGPNTPYVQGYNPQSSTSGLASALGQAIPGIVSAFGGTSSGSGFGGGGGGGGGGSYYNPGPSGFSTSQILGY